MSNRQTVSGIESLIRRHLRKYKTPFMLIRRHVLERQYRLFRKHLRDVDIFYAIKANPSPCVIKTFMKLGAGFDVASAAEIDLVLSLGGRPNRMIYANPVKSTTDIAWARKQGVRFMVFDNEPELYKIAEHCPHATVLLRLKVENVGSLVELSLKFGADADQAVFLLKKARQLHLKPAGIHFHVGSQCTNPDNYVRALELAAAIFKESKNTGLELSTLDLGGGFPIRHFDHDDHLDFESIARQIRVEVRRLFPKSTRLIAEPGRFFAGPAAILVTQVIGRTFRNNKNYYYLNDGIYGDFSGIVFDHCKYEFKTLRRGQRFLSTLAGPTCDSFDTISVSEELPELEVGSIVYVKNIGAYSSASADCRFNGFRPAQIVFVP